jgi:hypothetical protein
MALAMDELMDIKLSRLIMLDGAFEVTLTSNKLASKVTMNPYSSRVNLPFSILTISFNNFVFNSACPKDFTDKRSIMHIGRIKRFKTRFFI